MRHVFVSFKIGIAEFCNCRNVRCEQGAFPRGYREPFYATQDAAIMKAKVTALMCGYVRNLEGGPADDMESGEMSMEPGTVRRLRAGEEMQFSSPVRTSRA
jgi:hypothetical protein